MHWVTLTSHTEVHDNEMSESVLEACSSPRVARVKSSICEWHINPPPPPRLRRHRLY